MGAFVLHDAGAESSVPGRADFGQRAALGLLHRLMRRGDLRVRFGDGSVEQFGDGARVLDGRAMPPLLMTAPPWRAWARLIANPELNFPRTYVDGLWTLAEGDLASLIFQFRANARGLEANPIALVNRLRWAFEFQVRRINPVFQCKPRIRAHYDRGDQIYASFLDPHMQYSCAFFPHADATLEAAQEHKMRTTLERLDIDRAGRTVLDIGCGWGGLSRFVARETGAHVTGITISPSQYAFAEARRAETGSADLRARLRYEEADYRRHCPGEGARYDRIVSVGMLEHVGLWHYPTYFRAIRRLLKPGGRALVHSIVAPGSGPTAEWVAKEVFPGGYIPSEHRVRAALAGTGLDVEALHRHAGWHYRRTLECWDERFADAWRTPMAASAAGRRVFRHWRMYLAGCQNAFESQVGMYVAQFVLRPA